MKQRDYQKVYSVMSELLHYEGSPEAVKNITKEDHLPDTSCGITTMICRSLSWFIDGCLSSLPISGSIPGLSQVLLTCISPVYEIYLTFLVDPVGSPIQRGRIPQV